MQDTHFGLAPSTVDELVMLIAEQEDRRREEDAAKVVMEEEVSVEGPGKLTCLEIEALRGVDIVEFAADPVNRYNVARGVIRLAFWGARKLRG